MLEEAKQKTEALLRNVLPSRIATELITTGKCKPQMFSDVTVCFADLVNFTTISSQLSPEVIISELNIIFTAFDQIVNNHRCEHIKTIGDAYMFVCGLPEHDPHHAHNVARAALELVDFLRERNITSEYAWPIRVGIHSGPVVGGIVGTEKYLYDIFGDTVNIAARMEELCEPMEITVSGPTMTLLKDNFNFDNKKEVDVKGLGRQTVYTLTGIK
jgi:class 3 adenylate cyclase